ncbi:YybH family protein [Aurantiacibacter poecillastricola]|uniref:YybH family protein n=1 Tax=Aurantiacibacter poecillastricola TaxID=3064385 RepID=UPI00273E8B29|nr:SgcJ/EcaC family oxidoreductase [Aurantiacibacter sp. 219JJ12-13]MDP5260120.1 SgcJ/EcaC family oxidoreductase [Aurantiacibacter sp. 219JJ12-13]
MPEPDPAEGELTEATAPPQVAEIEAVMEDSAAGWNAGDMNRFLAIYSRSPQASFVGSGGLLRGVEAMEERYREAYDWSRPDPSGRGVLTFETEDFRPLGDRHALYIGRYVLTYPDDREPATGLTSLVFAREENGWKIIADHSS